MVSPVPKWSSGTFSWRNPRWISTNPPLPHWSPPYYCSSSCHHAYLDRIRCKMRTIGQCIQEGFYMSLEEPPPVGMKQVVNWSKKIQSIIIISGQTKINGIPCSRHLGSQPVDGPLPPFWILQQVLLDHRWPIGGIHQSFHALRRAVNQRSKRFSHFHLIYLIGATRVAVLVVLDEGQEPVERRRSLDDVLDTVALGAVL